MNTKDMEELKTELANVKEMNRNLFEQNVLPVIKTKEAAFLDAFEEYFRERGFVIRRKTDSVTVSFDVLHFKAFCNENQEILITKGREQIALIPVTFKGASEATSYLHGDPLFAGTMSQWKKEVERQKGLSEDLLHPDVFYTGGESGPWFDNPMTVLYSIFNV